MKVLLLTLSLITFSFNVLIAQKFAIESIGVNAFSDLSIVDKDLLQEGTQLLNQVKVGYGLGLEVSNRFKKQYHLKLGLNLVNRKFGSVGNLNQSEIPPPNQSFTRELVQLNRLSYQIVEIPFKAGITILKKEKQEWLFYVGGSVNFILSGNYRNSFANYDGIYDKKGLKGFSGLMGVQSSFTLKNKLNLIYRLENSFYNRIGKDAYIGNNGEREISVNHRILKLIIGIEKRF